MLSEAVQASDRFDGTFWLARVTLGLILDGRDGHDMGTFATRYYWYQQPEYVSLDDCYFLLIFICLHHQF